MVGPAAVWAQSSDTIRIATYAAPLSRDGPGLLLRDIVRGEDEQIAAIVAVIDHVSPDVLVLTDIDFDEGGAAVSALSGTLSNPYPYHFFRRPNAGLQTGLDLDGDGFTGDARDALGYGRFLGDGGIAVLSRYPIDFENSIDFTATLWRDIPGATLPVMDGAPFPSAKAQSQWPVSSTAHWAVPIVVEGTTITLLAFSATPPVFDGPEDANGLRNRDELRMWEAVLDGDFGPIPQRPIVIGNINADPYDGQGLRDGIAQFLSRPDLQDPQPASDGAQMAADADHVGNPAYDTADWSDDGPGNLRVSYVLPSAELLVRRAGVFWPAPDDPDARLLNRTDTGPHRLVWVDIAVP